MLSCQYLIHSNWISTDLKRSLAKFGHNEETRAWLHMQYPLSHHSDSNCSLKSCSSKLDSIFIFFKTQRLGQQQSLLSQYLMVQMIFEAESSGLLNFSCCPHCTHFENTHTHKQTFTTLPRPSGGVSGSEHCEPVLSNSDRRECLRRNTE